MGIVGRRRLGVVALVVAALIVIPVALVVLSQPAASANTVLSILSGSAQVAKGQADFTAATDGELLGNGDRVRTADASHALITFFDGSTLEIEPATTVTVTAAAANSSGSITIQITQTIGRTWASVQHLSRADSKFEITTPTSTASVRGTGFLTDVSPSGDTTVQTTDGTVEVTAQGQTVQVTEGLQTTVTQNSPPTQPAPGPPPPNKLRFGMHSPAYLAVVDPLGRACGITLTNATPVVVRQIPGCLASDPGTEPQLVDVPAAPAGTYHIVIASIPPGGAFTATASAVDGAGNLSFNYSVGGDGQPGAVFGSDISVEQGPGGTLRARGIGALTVLQNAPLKVVVQGSPSPAPTASGTPDPSVFRPLPTIGFAAGPDVTPSPQPTIAAASPTPSPTPSPSPTPTPSPTPSPTPPPPAATPTPAPTPTSTVVPTPTPTPSPSPTPTPSPSPSPAPTAPPTVRPTSTPAPMPTPTPTPGGPGTITGLVLASGSPAANVVVDAFVASCAWPACTRTATATTSASGTFALTGLGSGTYHLRFKKTGYPVQWVNASEGVWMVGCFGDASSIADGATLDGPYDTVELDASTYPCLTLTPPSGPSGTSAAVFGEGFVAGSSVSATVNGAPYALAAPVTVTADGTFSASVTVPTAPGCYVDLGFVAGSIEGHASFLGTPCIEGTSNAYIGGSISLNGYGWPAAATVTFTFDGSPLATTPVSVTADGSGSIGATFVMPAATVGTHTVAATSGGTTRTFEVATAAPYLSVCCYLYTYYPGTTVNLTANGFPTSTPYTLTFGGVTVTGTTSATGMSTGMSFTIGDTPMGPTVLTVTAGAYTATSTLPVSAILNEVSPSSGGVGTVVTVTGHGFPASATGTLTFQGEPAPFAITTDATGKWTTTVTVTIAQPGGRSLDAVINGVQAGFSSFQDTTPYAYLSSAGGYTELGLGMYRDVNVYLTAPAPAGMTIALTAPAGVSLSTATLTPVTGSTTAGTVRLTGTALTSGQVTVTPSTAGWLARSTDLSVVVPQLWVYTGCAMPLHVSAANGATSTTCQLIVVAGAGSSSDVFASGATITFVSSLSGVTAGPATIVADTNRTDMFTIAAGSTTGAFTLTGTLSLSGSPARTVSSSGSTTPYPYFQVDP